FKSDKKIVESVKKLAARFETTEFNVLFSAYNLLLWKYSAQQNFLVGVPFANRENIHFEKLIGYFVNVLPVPVNISGDMTFEKLLESTKSDFLEISQDQNIPSELLLNEFGNNRELSRTPLYQTLFTL